MGARQGIAGLALGGRKYLEAGASCVYLMDPLKIARVVSELQKIGPAGTR
jgi:hypothetical protein